MTKFWKPRERLNGPGYFFGRTHGGKTWSMLSMAQIYNSAMHYKIFDIYGGKYKEEGFWCFPSDEKKLWFDFQVKAGDMVGVGPKEYKVNLLFPCFSYELPKEIPQHLPRIVSKVFTIYFKTIKTEDIALLIGDPSKNSVYFWNRIVEDLPDNATGADIKAYVDDNLKEYKELSIYKLFLKPALDYRLLAGKDCPLNIDLIAEAKDKERISVLCHYYIPSRNWEMFVMNYIQRVLLFELAERDKIPKENISLFREAGDFMKKVDKDIEAGEQIQIFRNKLTNIARYGRRGLILFMDTQSPSDTKNLIEGQEDLLCIKEISILDIEDIVTKLRSERRMSKKIKDGLHKLEQKQMVIVERKQKAVLIDHLMPPRTMAYKNKSFLKVWEEKINDWKKTYEDLKIIEEMNRKTQEKIQQKKEMNKIVSDIGELPIQEFPTEIKVRPMKI